MKRIAITTFHNAVNYGAILQCYALQTYLEGKFTCVVGILDYTPQFFRKVFYDPMKPWTASGLRNKGKAIAKFILLHNEMRNLSRKHRELLRFSKEKLHLVPIESEKAHPYDYYITGSDQIWNLELLGNDTTYLLDFVSQGRKISYAASFKIIDVDAFARNAYQQYLPTFSNISVRESDLKKYLWESFGINATCVLDPTLLIGVDFWKKEISQEPVIAGKYLLLYYVNLPKYLIDRAFEYAKSHALKVVSLNTLRGRKDYLDYSGASIEEFLNLIAYAETVFTTSFHGMSFSILFERNFYYEIPENSYNNNARLHDLAVKLGLQAQNITQTKFERIPWSDVRKYLSDHRSISEEFLLQAVSLS